jgi:hypothetical protein
MPNRPSANALLGIGWPIWGGAWPTVAFTTWSGPGGK